MLVKVQSGIYLNPTYIVSIEANGNHACRVTLAIHKLYGYSQAGGQGSTNADPIYRDLPISAEALLELINKETALVHALEDAAKATTQS